MTCDLVMVGLDRLLRRCGTDWAGATAPQRHAAAVLYVAGRQADQKALAGSVLRVLTEPDLSARAEFILKRYAVL